MASERKRTLPESSQNGSNGTSKKLKITLENWRGWGVDSVAEYLQENDLSVEVVGAFIEHKIRGRILGAITEERLDTMGIDKMGDRLEVLEVLKPFQQSSVGMPFSDIADRFKVFNDPIHGHIELHPLCVAVMDTPQFHRLRYIKQLGGCYYVFPGATTNRFEHSIGVSHLAGQLVRALRNRQPELNISDKDILCVELAGLCHDLGHGPFSHMFDGQFIPLARPSDDWRHEDASKMMFDHMVEANNLRPKFEEFGLNDNDIQFITEQICGPQKNLNGYKGRGKEKHFLYEIVANKRNGIDVDKWDYFARDCHCLGISNNFDHLRFMKFARVITVNEEKQICSRDKEIGNVYDMFSLRAHLHRQVYQHKVKTVVEHMITEAFLKADKFLQFTGKGGKKKTLSETIYDPVAFTRVTDHVFQQILYSTSDELKEAREILECIERREIYKCIGQSKPAKAGDGMTFHQSDIQRLKAEIVEGSDLSPDDIVIQIVSLDFGMKEKNPIDHVRFYKKSKPTEAIQIPREEVSHMLPESFREQLIRVFVKKTDEDTFNMGKKAFKRWCQQRKMKPSQMFDDLYVPRLSQSLSQMSQTSDYARSEGPSQITNMESDDDMFAGSPDMPNLESDYE